MTQWENEKEFIYFASDSKTPVIKMGAGSCVALLKWCVKYSTATSAQKGIGQTPAIRNSHHCSFRSIVNLPGANKQQQ